MASAPDERRVFLGIRRESGVRFHQVMSDTRKNPDALLAAIQKSEQAAQRGRLKVFLGMSAGVGKTYAMLEAAHRAKRDGRDVVKIGRAHV